MIPSQGISISFFPPEQVPDTLCAWKVLRYGGRGHADEFYLDRGNLAQCLNDGRVDFYLLKNKYIPYHVSFFFNTHKDTVLWLKKRSEARRTVPSSPYHIFVARGSQLFEELAMGRFIGDNVKAFMLVVNQPRPALKGPLFNLCITFRRFLVSMNVMHHHLPKYPLPSKGRRQ